MLLDELLDAALSLITAVLSNRVVLLLIFAGLCVLGALAATGRV